MLVQNNLSYKNNYITYHQTKNLNNSINSSVNFKGRDLKKLMGKTSDIISGNAYIQDLKKIVSSHRERMQEIDVNIKSGNKGFFERMGLKSTREDHFSRLNGALREQDIIKQRELQELQDVYNQVGTLNLEMDPEKKDAWRLFQKRRANMPPNQGFNTVGGYEKEVEFIKNQFIEKGIAQEKREGRVLKEHVPDVILFYGPTGTGKSTFSKAVADETLAYKELIKIPKGSPSKRQKFLVEELHKLGVISNQLYENSGIEKTRTMIIVDEAEQAINPKVEGYDELMEFLKGCSETYKCTVFLTTNRPLLLGDGILSNNVTPIKVPLGPPTKKDMEKVIENVFNQYNIPSFDFANVVEKLHSGYQNNASNSGLSELCCEIFSKNKKPTEQDFLSFIEDVRIGNLKNKDQTKPNITKDEIDKFNEYKAKLNY